MSFKHVWAIQDHGYRTYQVGGKKIDEKRPGRCLVRWPDDHEEYITFRPVPYTDVIYGHGCGVGGQSVMGFLPTFTVEVHGAEIAVPLDTVAVDPATISQED
jgi:hypothetical protein